jgi:putative ABC transport system permease protein
LQAYSFDDEAWNPYYVGSMNFLYVIGAFFIFLICGAVSLSVVNTTTMGILERLREIGTLRSLGFNPQRTIRLFVRENLLLSLLGIALGIGLSIATAIFVNHQNFRFHPPSTQGDIQFLLILNETICFLSAASLILLNVATTFLVLRRSTRVPIVKLLTDSGG